MGLKMLEPWKNPRSKNYWFRRRIRNSISAISPVAPKSRSRSVRPTTTRRCCAARRRTSGSNAPGGSILSAGRPTSCRRSRFRRWPAWRSTRPSPHSAPIPDVRSSASGRCGNCRRRSAATGIWCRSACTYADRFGEEAAAFLERRGLHLVGDTYELFIREFVKAKEDAENALLRKANGHFGPDPEAEKYASAAVLKRGGGKVLALATFDAYAEDAGLAPKTRSAWRSKIRDLIAFVGHDDLARLTRKEVLAWKEKLQTEILPARKAKRKNVKLAACVDAKPARAQDARPEDDPERLLGGAEGDTDFRGKPRGPDGKRREGHRRQGEEEKETAGEGFHRRRGPPDSGRLAGAATEGAVGRDGGRQTLGALDLRLHGRARE